MNWAAPGPWRSKKVSFWASWPACTEHTEPFHTSPTSFSLMFIHPVYCLSAKKEKHHTCGVLLSAYHLPKLPSSPPAPGSYSPWNSYVRCHVKKCKGLVDTLNVMVTASDHQKFDTTHSIPEGPPSSRSVLMKGSLRSYFFVHGLSPEPPSSSTMCSSSSLSRIIQSHHSFLTENLVPPSYLTPSQHTHTHTGLLWIHPLLYAYKYS